MAASAFYSSHHIEEIRESELINAQIWQGKAKEQSTFKHGPTQTMYTNKARTQKSHQNL